MGRSKVPIITNTAREPFFSNSYNFIYGRVDEIRQGGDTAIVSFGSMFHRALKVKELLAEKQDVAVLNVSSPIYIDDVSIEMLKKYKKIYILEDHIPSTGLYATFCAVIAAGQLSAKIYPFGITGYPFSGSPDDIYDLMGISPQAVADKILSLA
jgi:transketolase